MAGAEIPVVVVLHRTLNDVPVASRRDPVVLLVHVTAVVVLARVGETVAHILPPRGIGVAVLPRGPRVPRIVEHLRTAVEVGRKREVVRGHKGHHRLHFGFVIALRRLTGLRERAVKILIMAVVADGDGRFVDLVVGGVVRAIRIVQGANPEVHLINQLRDAAVRIVIGKQIVDQPQHHIVTHHLITVDGRGVEHRRLALVVAEVVADVGAENAVVRRRFVQ